MPAAANRRGSRPGVGGGSTRAAAAAAEEQLASLQPASAERAARRWVRGGRGRKRRWAGGGGHGRAGAGGGEEGQRRGARVPTPSCPRAAVAAAVAAAGPPPCTGAGAAGRARAWGRGAGTASGVFSVPPPSSRFPLPAPLHPFGKRKGTKGPGPPGSDGAGPGASAQVKPGRRGPRARGVLVYGGGWRGVTWSPRPGGGLGWGEVGVVGAPAAGGPRGKGLRVASRPEGGQAAVLCARRQPRWVVCSSDCHSPRPEL